MNKELFSFLFLASALVVGALYYTNTIQKPFIDSLNYIKTSYNNTLEFTTDSINKHFAQAQQIELFNAKLKHYEENHLLMQQLASEVVDMYQANQSSLVLDPKAQLVRTISYQKFDNFNRVWIDVEDYNSSKIYGLVYKELVAGIVIPKNNHPLALLNQDIKSTYAVHIGDALAPGIAHGNNNDALIVKYIPAWFDIKEGDEVVTSGLDDIFFKGLKVGRVISSSKAQGYQTAIVKPYYKANNPNYFHMIRRVK